jgi:hypothetical protein
MPRQEHAKKDSPEKMRSSKPQKVAFFFKGHHTLVTFIGAIIIFFTFIIKEGLREQLKDLVNSTDAAQATFLIRAENHRTWREVIDLRDAFTEVWSQQPNSETSVKAIDARLETILSSLYQYHFSLQNAASLLERLPKRSRRGSAQVFNVAASGLRNLEKQVESFRQKIKTGQISDSDQNQTATEIADSTSNLGKTIRTLEESTFEEAMHEKEVQESHFKIYTWTSYFLYALGWGLGLTARLLNEDRSEVECG